MPVKALSFVFKINIIVIIFSFSSSAPIFAQDTIKQETIKSIKDIPHKTAWQKWMWMHRSIAYIATKERPVFFDTNYIVSYKKSLVITLPLTTRFLNFSLVDWKTKNELHFSPNIQYDLGISVNSHWASFLINTGVKVYNNDKNIKGQTKYNDYQFNVYSKRITTDAFFQYYKGFYISNSQSYPDYISDKTYAIRKDVGAVTFGASTYYILNYKKFSYRNSFAFTERQKKSAGSLLLGAYYSLFGVWSDSTLVTDPFRNSFDILSRAKSGGNYSGGSNIGYIYTLVFLKKCYVTLSLVEGLGFEQTYYTREDYSTYKSKLNFSSKLNVRSALGYNTGKFYAGLMGVVDYFTFTSTKSDTKFNYNLGKFRAFVGYRFSYEKAERRVLRKLNLIDYRL